MLLWLQSLIVKLLELQTLLLIRFLIMLTFFRWWRWGLSNLTQSSTDLKDVFAFQNDTRYKRITELMNMPRFYPLIYHFFSLYQKCSSPSITACHTTQRPMLSCLNSLDSISVKKRRKVKSVFDLVNVFACVCVTTVPPTIHKQLPLRRNEQLVENLFLWYTTFTETTARRRDDWWISPCQKHHWRTEIGNAIYNRQDTMKRTNRSFSPSFTSLEGKRKP